jgi:S1-C subfamily serine protease
VVARARSAPSAPQGILGAQLTDLDPAVIRTVSQQNTDHGVFVLNVPAGSPGARMGLEVGDLIVMVGDVEITSLPQLHRIGLTAGSDKPASYTVLRKGKRLKLLYDPK